MTLEQCSSTFCKVVHPQRLFNKSCPPYLVTCLLTYFQSSLLLLLLSLSLLPVTVYHYYRPKKNFSEGTVFSRVCDFVLFLVFRCLSVTTVTLERLHHSVPNFHT